MDRAPASVVPFGEPGKVIPGVGAERPDRVLHHSDSISQPAAVAGAPPEGGRKLGPAETGGYPAGRRQNGPEGDEHDNENRHE